MKLTKLPRQVLCILKSIKMVDPYFNPDSYKPPISKQMGLSSKKKEKTKASGCV